MRVRAGIDTTTDLRHPQLDAVVREHRERQAELVPIEGTCWLSDDHRVEATVGTPQRVEQHSRLLPSLPRQRPRLPDVEELRDDVAVVWLDEGFCARDLPAAG